MDFSNINIQDLQIDHTIDVNPSSGSASATVNIPLSGGRSGFNPSLSLRYSSSSRNSIFGMGWSLGGLPFISIDTRKGLPKYDGTENFAFVGSDALVPQLIKNGTSWQQRVDEHTDYWIYYYRAKYEDAFTRFERWVKKTSGEVHWRTRSKNNVISVYGFDSSGSTKISDPETPGKVFLWLLEGQYDDNGNAIHYKYREENSDNVDHLSSYETGRIKKFNSKGFTQKYPERILYGNTKPVRPDAPLPANNKWLFEVVFDYGEFDPRPYTTNQPAAGSKWAKRQDPFSVYNPGFEIRTYRLCNRILVYHHFDELSVPTSLTGIFECTFNKSESGTTLKSVTYTGIRRDLGSGTYSEKALPELIFNYTQPEIGRTFRGIVQETNENLPQGFNHPKTRVTDLLGEGIPGILTETANTWYYKPNLGNGTFGKQTIVINKPSQETGVYALGDFDQDGNINLFALQGRTAGYYEYDRDSEKWSGFKAFKNIPQVPHSKFIDVESDGFPDLVVERDDKIVCYPFKGKEGFGKPYEFSKPVSNGVSYAPFIGDNLSLDYFLADMTGDGLPDQVRIKNGRVEYFPNMGNGHFGEVVVMEDAPVIDFETSFDASRIRLYDLDGSGTTDIIYLGNGAIRYWHNASGNKFIEGGRITNLPYIDNFSTAVIMDFLGNGTPCLVWSSSLNHLQYSTIQYLELTGGVKPRLLTSLENSMGKEVQIEYGHSGIHYLEAKRSKAPWISKIPAHLTVVNKKIIIDHITNARFTTQYKYRDGHYDGNERTFTTFGLVEQYDTELFENTSLTHDKDYVQPSCLKTWFHNGIFGWSSKRAARFYSGDTKQQFLNPQHFEQTEALEYDDFEKGFRSLAGKVIRQEMFAANTNGDVEGHPYQITQNAYCIRRLQPKTKNQDSCFFAYQTEVVNSNYEKKADDPRIAHHLTVAVNEYGDIGKELNVFYSRRDMAADLPAQNRDVISAALHRYVHTNTVSTYQPGVLYESKGFEINHITRTPDELLQLKVVQSVFDSLISNALDYDQPLPSGGTSRAKLTAWDRTYFWNTSFDDVLPLGQTAPVLFAHHEESACFNDDFINQTYSGRVTPALLSSGDEGNYVKKDGYWWQRTPVNHFTDAEGFFSLDRVERKPGAVTQYKYDPYHLSVIEINDPSGNVTGGEIDYNVVEPFRLIDQNDNVSEVLYDALGMTIATFWQGSVLDATNTLQKYGNGRLAGYTRRSDETFANILADPQAYLQQADSFLYYDFNCWKDENTPLRSINLIRENLIHDGKGNVDASVKYQMVIEYQDGFGRTMQSKQKVEPGLAIKRQTDGSVELDPAGVPVEETSNNRWLVSGHTVYNNKQLPVRQFQPFFSSLIEFEDDGVLETYGVSAHNYYDPIGRMYRADFPDGTFSEVIITAWEIHSFDQNDTVDRSFYKIFREFLPTGDPEKIALTKSLAHNDTPTIVKMDPLGRESVTVQINNDGTERKVENRFDINGNIIDIIDARGLKAFKYKRDMLGRLLYERSMDAGEKWSFHDNLDQAIHLWDGRGVHHRTRYDKSDRVVSVQVDGALGLNQITERFVYGEDSTLTQARDRNLRGQLVKHYDQAGTQEVKTFTPEGLPLVAERKLLDQYLAEPDWNTPAAVNLQADTFTSQYSYDAIGRPFEQKLADGTTRKYIFNQGGGVQKVLVSTDDGVMSEAELLKGASYDAQGLRQQALLGNNVAIDYSYDRETFRLKGLHAHKATGTSRTYQDMVYTYDPAGNLVYFLDRAQQPAAASPHVFEGLNVSAHSEFEYDALYQLTSAKGRVHQALLQHDYADRSRETSVPANWGKGTRHITLNNGASIERYTRKYEYDVAGNIKSVKHTGATQSWTKQIWTSATSNRSLPLNDLNGIAITNPEGRFDDNGNCMYLPHLRELKWNYRNQIARAVVIDRSAQGKPNDEEYYVYGGDGMRVRKVTQRVVDVANETVELVEKVYLDGCEIRRITRGGTEILRRFTSRITDGDNKVALIHSWEKDNLARETSDITQKKIHYQLSNHLGSASLELDENGAVITCEEYFPYGGTSFIAGRKKREIDLKDYRYSGKERDDFTGLYYFGYRYYAHWIGGWLSPDPLGPEDSENLYLYVQNNPVNLVDPNGLQSTRVNIRMLTSPAAFPEELRERADTAGTTFFVEGIDEKYDYTFSEIVQIARDSGREILVYDREATRRFSVFMADSSDANYQAYRELMYAIEGDLEEEYEGTDFVIYWHEMKSFEPPSVQDESEDSQLSVNSNDADNSDKRGGNNANNGDGNQTGNLKERRHRDNQTSGQGDDSSGNGNRTRRGHKDGSPRGKEGGVRGGSENGVVGGQIGGSPDGNSTTGTIAGHMRNGGNESGSGSAEGSTNGSTQGIPGGSPDGSQQGGGVAGQSAESGGGNGQVDWGSPAGGNPDITDEEPAWWQRALLAMAGAVYSVANIFIEAGKQIYDMGGLAVSCFGLATGWYDYEHEVVSAIGKAAEQGQGTLDIFKNMGRGIIETPGRAWDAAERGDWFSFGAESMNIYMIGRSGQQLARGGFSSIRSGLQRSNQFFRRGANPSFSGQGGFMRFGSAHAGMGASTGRGMFSMSRGYGVRNSPVRYGLWRAGIAGRTVMQGAMSYARLLSPRRWISSYGKGVLGRELARIKAILRGDIVSYKGSKLLGREINATVDGVNIRADLVIMTEHGFIKIVEAKFGPHSKWTPNQELAWRGGSTSLIVETFWGSKVKIPEP